MFVLLKKYRQQEQIHHRNREFSVSSRGSGTHSCTAFHHRHCGIQVKVGMCLDLVLLNVATPVTVSSFSSISALTDFCLYCVYLQEGKYYMNLNGDVNAIER